MYSFPNFELIYCSMSSSTCCFLSHIYMFLRRQIMCSGIPISLRIFHSLLWSTQSKARILESAAFLFSKGSSRHRDWTQCPVLQADSLPSRPPGKPLLFSMVVNNSHLLNSYDVPETVMFKSFHIHFVVNIQNKLMRVDAIINYFYR